jgi:hypothetical protein
MMLTELEFLQRAEIDQETLKLWVEEERLFPVEARMDLPIQKWISPE